MAKISHFFLCKLDDKLCCAFDSQLGGIQDQIVVLNVTPLLAVHL